MSFKLGKLCVAVITLGWMSHAWATEQVVLQLIAEPGKTVCQWTTSRFDKASVKLELCFTQGKKSHDVYALKLDNKNVLRGIDDEIKQGVTAAYRSDRVNLKCSPKLLAPKNPSSESIALLQMEFGLPLEEARELAGVADASEIGRHCTVSYRNTPLAEIDVLFE